MSLCINLAVCTQALCARERDVPNDPFGQEPQRHRRAYPLEGRHFFGLSLQAVAGHTIALLWACDWVAPINLEQCAMKAKLKIALAVVVGTAVGATAVQVLHAQGKPKAYQVTELEIVDEEAWKAFVQAVRAAQQTASGRNLRTARGKVVSFVGEPPKHVGITEFDSLDQALAYRNGSAFKDLEPQRSKAIKIVRQYTVEVEN